MAYNNNNNNQATQPQGQDKGHRGEHEQRSGLLEKIFTVMSIVLVFGLAGFLAWESAHENTPAAFQVEVNEPQRRGEFVGVVVAVRNTGDDTAKAVQVRGEAKGADGKPVEAEATLDWLPGKSKRRVTLLFPGDADLSGVDVKVVGYEEP